VVNVIADPGAMVCKLRLGSRFTNVRHRQRVTHKLEHKHIECVPGSGERKQRSSSCGRSALWCGESIFVKSCVCEDVVVALGGECLPPASLAMAQPRILTKAKIELSGYVQVGHVFVGRGKLKNWGRQESK
jgi:hypothetical protein